MTIESTGPGGVTRSGGPRSPTTLVTRDTDLQYIRNTSTGAIEGLYDARTNTEAPIPTVQTTSSGGLAIIDPATGGAVEVGGNRVFSARLTSQKTLDYTQTSSGTPIPWDIALTGDATGIWTIGDPTYFYIPAGYTKARMRFCLELASYNSTVQPKAQAEIHKTTGIFNGYGFDRQLMSVDGTTALNGYTALISVAAGDKFSVGVKVYDADTNEATVFGDYKISWFEIELLP